MTIPILPECDMAKRTTQTKLLPRKILHQLYWQMKRIRLIEETMVDLYADQEMRCPVHLCIGQEAISAGVAAIVEKKDLMLSNHRAHGHYLAKGGDPVKLFAEIYGRLGGCAGGRGGSMHLVDLSVNFLGSTPIVASIIPVATGVAFGEKLQKRKTVTVVFLGEAAVEEGVFHESVNFAVLKKLPILYICENNLYSVYTPLSARQPSRSIARLVSGHGLDVMTADGNDVVAVYNIMQQAFVHIRAGRGPVFIELNTYRWREHCGPNFDNHIGYRTEAEFDKWKRKDPLVRFQRFVIDQKILSVGEIKKINLQLQTEISQVVKKAKASPLPKMPYSSALVYA